MENKEEEPQEEQKEKCAGGKWEGDCDEWECVGGCKYEKLT